MLRVRPTSELRCETGSLGVQNQLCSNGFSSNSNNHSANAFLSGVPNVKYGLIQLQCCECTTASRSTQVLFLGSAFTQSCTHPTTARLRRPVSVPCAGFTPWAGPDKAHQARSSPSLAYHHHLLCVVIYLTGLPQSLQLLLQSAASTVILTHVAMLMVCMVGYSTDRAASMLQYRMWFQVQNSVSWEAWFSFFF